MTFQELIEAKQLNKTQIANLVGVSRNCIYQYITKKRTPTLENMQKLADALEVDLQTIVNCFVKNEKEEK